MGFIDNFFKNKCFTKNKCFALIFLLYLTLINAAVLKAVDIQKMFIEYGKCLLQNNFLENKCITQGETLFSPQTLQNIKKQYGSRAKTSFLEPKLVLKRMTQNKNQDQSRYHYLLKIISVLWAVADQYKDPNTGKMMWRGSYTIADPQGIFFNFFKKYEIFSENNNAFMTVRDPQKSQSSHHKTTTIRNNGQAQQYGINMRFDANDPIYKILPQGQSHFLFGQIHTGSKKSVFIKFESYGISSLSEKLGHAGAFIKTRFQSKNPHKRLEKIVLPEIKDAYHEIMKDNIKIGLARGLTGKCQQKLSKRPLLFQMNQSILDCVTVDGIKKWRDLLDKKYKDEGGHKTASMRAGNEIVINPPKH
jgi:hypothetical protein